MQVTSEQLDRIVDQISSVVDPAGVVLFGSFARGDAHDHSDLDLMIIRDRDFQAGESRRKELGAIYRAVHELPEVPKDILLFTKSEFLEWRETTNHMIAVAWREGRVLSGEI